MGIEFFIPIPNPKSWEWNFSFPFPIPKVGNRFGYFPFPIPNLQKSFRLMPDLKTHLINMIYLTHKDFINLFLEANRNACCPMIRHSKEWKPNRCSQSNFIQRGFKSYGKCITTAPFKIIIIIVTLGILGVGIYGNILLRQEFDPTWFLPADTYLSKWFTANKKYFPFGKFLHTIIITGWPGNDVPPGSPQEAPIWGLMGAS